MPVAMMATLRRVLACEKGATLPLIGLVFLVLVAAVGLAVDYGRAQMVQSKLQASLDAAGLAAATVGNEIDNEATRRAIKLREANKYMEANFPVEYMNTLYPEAGNSYITLLQPTPDGEGLQIRAEGRVETLIMRVVGFDEVDVSAYTEIAMDTAQAGLEVALVLDNTGSMNTSMGGETRMTALKRSAKALVDDIYEKFDPNRTYIGVVPFSQAVRIDGAQAPGAMWRRTASSDVPIAGNVHCVYMDSQFFGASGAWYGDGVPSRNLSWGDTEQPPVTGASPSALFYNASPKDNDCPIAGITPLRNAPQAIKNGIDSMVGTGGTRIDLGAVWGWRLLSPVWRGQWNHASSDLPLDYNTQDSNKVVILLTDGEIDDTPNSVEAPAYERLSNICDNMKAQGILVYPITLHTTIVEVRNAMAACATSPEHYFHVAPGESLDAVFARIAASLANLRISK